MTLLLMESFDLYPTGTTSLPLQHKWTSYRGGQGGGEQIVSSASRTGSNSLSISTNSNQAIQKQVAGADEHATFVVGFGLYATDLAANRSCVQFLSDSLATTHLSLFLNTTGSLSVYRGQGSTLLGTTGTGLIPGGTWHYVEMKATLNDTTGTVQVWVDGYSALSLTSQDTKNSGTKTVFDGFSLGPVSGGGSAPFYFDDVYLVNGAGSVNNDRLGEIRVQVLLPSGNGSSSQGVGSDSDSTNNYQLVDDQTPSTATSDYVDLGTTNDTDLYAMADLSITTGTIYGVTAITYDEKTDAGTRSIAHVVRSGGTTYVGSDIVESTSFAFHQTLWETNPNTSAAWTISDVNALEAGAKAR